MSLNMKNISQSAQDSSGAFQHHFKLSALRPQEETEGGSRTKASKANFPMLSGMSLYKLVLNRRGLREPHWHANADELGYCLKGKLLVSLFHTGDTKASFVVNTGEAFFIHSGALHYIENVGDGVAEVILCFSSDDTEDFGLAVTMSVFSNAVLANTWDVPEEVFRSFNRSDHDVFAALNNAPGVIPEEAEYVTPYKYSLEATQPILQTGGGSARMARQNLWPILRNQALYSLRITGVGMREPHWHPETAELGFVASGRGRMSILSPSGKIDTYTMEEGDIYFIPKAYPHHIENLDDSDLHILVFFDQAMPRDIGLTGSIRSFSNEALGASTNNKPEFFQKLKKYYRDLFIVGKTNPVDPS